MNKIIILTIFMFISAMHLLAQTPEKMSYQAVVRYSDNSLVVQANVGLQILLRQGGPDGSIIFEETHQAITNINGLASLEIGTGSSTRSFGSIDWSQGPYFIETRIDPNGGSNYSVSGTSEILSVPYALQAKTASNFNGTIGENQILDLDHYSDLDINGEEAAFSGWDKDASNDFSGNYRDLERIPPLYTIAQVDSILAASRTQAKDYIQSLSLENKELTISGGNRISLESWDADASDDFSGDYNALFNIPELYTKNQVDSLVVNLDGGGSVAQSLNLKGEKLTISGGNSISFENWDVDSNDDFSGSFIDLIEVPELYTKNQVDSLVVNLNGGDGVVQSLNLDGQELTISGGNSISFENWDTDANDDFSGNYVDLKNTPSLFSGKYNDLSEIPEVYTKNQVDSLVVNLDGGGSVAQSLDLEGEKLTISGGNSISFENWDVDSKDDFSGNYIDLKNTPNLFSGKYNDLSEIPELYTKNQVDSLVVNLDGGGSVAQLLDLEGGKLSISGGNSISFENWDVDSSDDFSGDYIDLKNTPSLFSGNYNDLSELPDLYTKNEVDSLVVNLDGGGRVAQSLDLEGEKLSISGGNSISFENWDTDANDDFDGKYISLTEAPKIYTQAEVDIIKAEILTMVEANYSKKASIISIASSRNIISTDVGNTIACIEKVTLTIPSRFTAMEVGDVINFEVHGTQLTIQGASSVTINGQSGKSSSKGNNQIYTGGIIRKTGNNSYIVL